MWMPSPGLMALAAYLEVNHKSVDIMDATILARPWTDLEKRLKDGRYDIVGVTCSAATFHQDAVHAVRLIRRVLPNALIVGGGGHFSINAGDMLSRLPELDFIVQGEGEETLLALVNHRETGDDKGYDDIPGLLSRGNKDSTNDRQRPLIADLDTLPFPAYHKIELSNPVYQLHGMGERAVGLSTSRGCGDRCSYCSEAVLWQSRWRGRSGALVVEEMKKLHRDYRKSLFVFNENSFNQSRTRNESFLENLGRSGLKCDFWFQSRVKDILRDRDLLKDFKRLGCYEVMLGVESITADALNNYNKNQTYEQIREAAELLRSHGLMVMTNVMFGDEGDTEETLKQICDFAAEIGDFLVLCITTPLPGTRYYRRAREENRILEDDFTRYDFMHPIMANRAYSRDDILALQKKYLRRYYTRPVVFVKMLFSRNPFIRMAYRLIMRYAWYEARNREWIQKNYEPVPAYIQDERKP
jgi:radical SAM superfamily enzyme YgiQ (UPF0313 family)